MGYLWILSITSKYAQFCPNVFECWLTAAISSSNPLCSPNVQCGIRYLLVCSSIIDSMLAEINDSNIAAIWSLCNWTVGGMRIKFFSGNWFWRGKEFLFMQYNFYKCYVWSITLSSIFILLRRRFISISNDVPFSSVFDGNWPVWIQMQRFDSSWLISTVLLISCSTTVVKYKSRNSLENMSTKIVSRCSSSCAALSLVYIYIYRQVSSELAMSGRMILQNKLTVISLVFKR